MSGSRPEHLIEPMTRSAITPLFQRLTLSQPLAKVLRMKIKVIVERGEDGYFVAHCPALRSCWSQGKSRDEALRNIREAIELYLEPAPGRFVTDETHEVVELA